MNVIVTILLSVFLMKIAFGQDRPGAVVLKDSPGTCDIFSKDGCSSDGLFKTLVLKLGKTEAAKLGIKKVSYISFWEQYQISVLTNQDICERSKIWDFDEEIEFNLPGELAKKLKQIFGQEFYFTAGGIGLESQLGNENVLMSVYGAFVLKYQVCGSNWVERKK